MSDYFLSIEVNNHRTKGMDFQPICFEQSRTTKHPARI